MSDFMFIVPRVPHLRNMNIQLHYRDLPDCSVWPAPLNAFPSWYRDPGFDPANPAHRMMPLPKHYINGQLVSEDTTIPTIISRVPLDTKRVPRRGLIQVFPDDPEYESLCKKQGLPHLLTPSPERTNGVAQTVTDAMTNGIVSSTDAAPIQSLAEVLLNGDAPKELPPSTSPSASIPADQQANSSIQSNGESVSGES